MSVSKQRIITFVDFDDTEEKKYKLVLIDSVLEPEHVTVV